MKLKFVLLFLVSIIIGCSEDSTDKKISSPEIKSGNLTQKIVKTEPKEPYPNSPAIQDLKPDLHVSGMTSNNISGAASNSEHISGQ